MPSFTIVHVHRSSIVVLALLAGCPNRPISSVPIGTGGETTKEIPTSANVDILFVIDNSQSTQDKQAVFEANLPEFVNALGMFQGFGLPNLHIGVVDTTVDIGATGYGGCPSPDTNDNGRLQNTAQVPGCTPPSGRFISDIANADGTRTTNYGGSGLAPDLGPELQCIGEVGITGCGFEAQLQAMKLALDGSNPDNSGFIRSDAYLAVIFLTDEDDASAKDGSVFAPGGSPMFDDSSTNQLTSDFAVQPFYAYQCTPAISPTTPGTYSDCTVVTSSYLQDPAYYATFLTTIKDPSQIVVAVIAGPPPGLTTNDNPGITCPATLPDGQPGGCGPMNNQITTGSLTIPGNSVPQMMALEPACSFTETSNGDPAVARPAVRLADFLSHVLVDIGPDRGRFYSVCQTDYSAALTDIGHTLFNALSPCLEGPIDPTNSNPSNPGLNLQCSVADILNQGTSAEQQTAIPPCKMDNATTPDPHQPFPCWWADQNTTKCPAPDLGYEINLDRNGIDPPPGTVVDVQCAVTPT